jgi:hypothetical protein
MSFKIPTKLNIALADKEDAVRTFKTVVNNGQGRLALEVLLDIVDGLVAKIEDLEKKIGSEPKAASVSEPAPKQAKAASKSKAQVEQAPVEEEVQVESE